MTTREWYEAIRLIKLRDGKAEAAIADELGVSRAFVQWRVWAMKFAARLGDQFLTPYFDDQFTDHDLQILHRAYTAGAFQEAWEEWRYRGTLGVIRKTAKEIETASIETSNPTVRRALRWTIGLEESPE